MIPRRNSFLLGAIFGCIVGIAGLTVARYLTPSTTHESSSRMTEVQSQSDIDQLKLKYRDVGDRLHEFGRPAIWDSTRIDLDETGFTAAAGPARYTDEDNEIWDYYSIDVEKPDSDGTVMSVYFSRDYKIDDIPPDLLKRDVAEIASYDKETNVVTFSIGPTNVRYKIPVR